MRRDENAADHGEYWWAVGAWKEPVSYPPTSASDHLRTKYNPACQHDHCAHTILNCDECKRYSNGS